MMYSHENQLLKYIDGINLSAQNVINTIDMRQEKDGDDQGKHIESQVGH